MSLTGLSGVEELDHLCNGGGREAAEGDRGTLFFTIVLLQKLAQERTARQHNLESE